MPLFLLPSATFRQTRILTALFVGSCPRVHSIPQSFDSFSNQQPPPLPPSSNVMHCTKSIEKINAFVFQIGIGKNRHCRIGEIFSKLPNVVYQKKIRSWPLHLSIYRIKKKTNGNQIVTKIPPKHHTIPAEVLPNNSKALSPERKCESSARESPLDSLSILICD